MFAGIEGVIGVCVVLKQCLALRYVMPSNAVPQITWQAEHWQHLVSQPMIGRRERDTIRMQRGKLRALFFILLSLAFPQRRSFLRLLEPIRFTFNRNHFGIVQ